MFGGKKRKRLEAAGVDANAVLTSVQDTGMTINDNPRVKLTFEVTRPDGGGTFEVQMKQTVSRVQVPRPGDTFVIRYDPEDLGNVELLGMSGNGGAGGASLDDASAGQVAAAFQAAGNSSGVTTASAAELLASELRLGKRLEVAVNPANPTREVAIDWPATAAAG